MKLASLHTIALRGVVPAVLVTLLSYPAGLVAQTQPAETQPAQAQTDGHIVSTQALQQQVQLTSEVRAQDIATVTSFLSTPDAERAMHDAHFDAVQVRNAIPTLSNAELKDLAARSADAQQKFAAGGLTHLLLTVIILAIVVIIVVAIVR